MRHKIGRWKFGRWLPEAHAAGRILRNLLALSKLVPPNVLAACWGTIWNRWCTGRRFQRSRGQGAQCRFGCSPNAHDAIEHYAHCPILKEVAQSLNRDIRFGLPDFLLCGTERDDTITFRALLVYGAYRAHSLYRCQESCPSRTQAVDCIIFFMRQAAARHASSLRVMMGNPQPRGDVGRGRSRGCSGRGHQANRIANIA